MQIRGQGVNLFANNLNKIYLQIRGQGENLFADNLNKIYLQIICKYVVRE